MSNYFSTEPMIEMFIFETNQIIEQLEQTIIASEKTEKFSEEAINEIFRYMHTIKGSAGMMMINNIASLAHVVEDLFYYLREKKPQKYDCSQISDYIFESIDFIKLELEKVKNSDECDGDSNGIIKEIKDYMDELMKDIPDSEKIKKPKSNKKEQFYIAQDKKNNAEITKYKVIVRYEDGCEMENVRAFTLVHNLKDIAEDISHIPKEIIETDESIEIIREKGFTVYFKTTKKENEIKKFLENTPFLKDFEYYELLENDDQEINDATDEITDEKIIIPKILDKILKDSSEISSNTQQNIISVNVKKLDGLMDLVGELVIAEAMVTQNPDLQGLVLDNFEKAARQLQRISEELQDMVMSIRMVPLVNTFHKMDRIVRDMSKKLNKDVHLELIGEDTEVDKNIIEHISDPLMHLVRNAIDHGLETNEERKENGKKDLCKITLEARNSGSEVLVIVKDNGKGLNKEKILAKAQENGLLHKAESEMTDKEIYGIILLPGFSTKENISEFSGRGVGMDVVTKNIEAVGGYVSIDSKLGEGTTVTLKIPLTLAIIDGMNLRVSKTCYTIPTTTIKESFRPKPTDIIVDSEGDEMIMVRGQCYPILRLSKLHNLKGGVDDLSEGIIIMVESDETVVCLAADELLGEQQVVVKAMPKYIKKVKGLAGCTLLGDGSISLILDVGTLIKFDNEKEL